MHRVPVIPNTQYLEVVVGKGRSGKVARAFFLVWRDDISELKNTLSACLPHAFSADPEDISSEEVVEIDVLPELDSYSAILSPKLIQTLVSFLPPMYRLRDWSLLFTTRSHGTSMQTFFNRTEETSAPSSNPASTLFLISFIFCFFLLTNFCRPYSPSN